MSDPLLRWFEFRHLPPHLQSVSAAFQGLAQDMVSHLEPSAERTVALRKLLEAKDAAVRAAILTAESGGRPSHISPKEG